MNDRQQRDSVKARSLLDELEVGIANALANTAQADRTFFEFDAAGSDSRWAALQRDLYRAAALVLSVEGQPDTALVQRWRIAQAWMEEAQRGYAVRLGYDV